MMFRSLALVLSLLLWEGCSSSQSAFSSPQRRRSSGRVPKKSYNSILSHSRKDHHRRGLTQWNHTYACNWTEEASFTGDVSTFLNGRHLVLGLGPFKPFAYTENDTSSLSIGSPASHLIWKGYSTKVMKSLSEYAGFTYEIQWRGSLDDAYEEWGATTYTELASNAINVFDLIGSFWIDTAERRSAGIVITHHFVDTSGVLIVPVAGDSSDWRDNIFTAFKPFTTGVWLALLGLVVVQAFVSWYLDVFVKRKKKQLDQSRKQMPTPGSSSSRRPSLMMRANSVAFERRNKDLTFWQYLEVSFGHISNVGMELKPNSAFNDLHTIVWGFLVVCIVAAYTANLASFFIVASTGATTFGTLAEASAAGSIICAEKGSVFAAYLFNSYPDLDVFLTETTAELGSQVLSGQRCAGAFLGQSEADMAISQSCGALEITGASYFNSGGGYGLSPYGCGPLILSGLDLALVEMEAEGILEQIWNDELDILASAACDAYSFQGTTDSNNSDESDAAEAELPVGYDEALRLSFDHLGGLFLTYLATATTLMLLKTCLWATEEAKLRGGLRDNASGLEGNAAGTPGGVVAGGGRKFWERSKDFSSSIDLEVGGEKNRSITKSPSRSASSAAVPMPDAATKKSKPSVDI